MPSQRRCCTSSRSASRSASTRRAAASRASVYLFLSVLCSRRCSRCVQARRLAGELFDFLLVKEVPEFAESYPRLTVRAPLLAAPLCLTERTAADPRAAQRDVQDARDPLLTQGPDLHASQGGALFPFPVFSSLRPRSRDSNRCSSSRTSCVRSYWTRISLRPPVTQTATTGSAFLFALPAPPLCLPLAHAAWQDIWCCGAGCAAAVSRDVSRAGQGRRAGLRARTLSLPPRAAARLTLS